MEKHTIQMIHNLVNDIIIDKYISSVINNKQEISGNFFVKNSGIISGIDVIVEIYKAINPSIKVNILKNNGEYVNRGDVILTVKGKAIDILKSKQLVLNFLQQLSGISTIVDKFSSEIKDLPCSILANYKGIPVNSDLYLKSFENGGGIRTSDYIKIDEYLVSTVDNLEEAINIIKKKNPFQELEMEVVSKEEFSFAVDKGIKRIILNSTNDILIDECLTLKNENVEFAVRGNFSIGRIRSLAAKGIDYIIVDNISTLSKGLEVEFKIYKKNVI